MTAWCLAGQRLSTAVRITVSHASRHSAFTRSPIPNTALHARPLTVCGLAPPAPARSRDTASKSRQSNKPQKAAHDSFYAPDSVSFESLRILPAVAEALQHGGFIRPSTVQELAMPVLAAGTDVVLAAETGSGKTICYLAPVIAQLLQLKQSQHVTQPDSREGSITPGALVLCPNAALCSQVKLVADSLTDGEGNPLLLTALVSNSSPPPFTVPDIVVTTPASLINITEAAHYGPEWTKGGILARMHHVILDEADLLLSGGFERDVGRILDGMKLSDKERKGQCLSQELGIPLEAFQALPRHVKAAAYEGGVQGMLDAGYDRPAAQPEDDILQPSTSDQGYVPADRQFERQYVFVAATLPSEGKKSIANDLRQKFPGLTWLAGNRLHQGLSTVTWAWRETMQENWKASLQDAVASALPEEGQAARVLVFAGTVAAANGVANALEEVGIPTHLYHKSISAADRAAALQRMSEHGGVMVCTDAAARGIDIPNVTHVIQAEFAASAVEFLHRVGRTARQGQTGQVTSLYSPDRKPLAEAVRAAVEADMPVEGAFSRNRSFSKKFKKYGQYVPRGQGLSA